MRVAPADAQQPHAPVFCTVVYPCRDTAFARTPGQCVSRRSLAPSNSYGSMREDGRMEEYEPCSHRGFDRVNACCCAFICLKDLTLGTRSTTTSPTPYPVELELKQRGRSFNARHSAGPASSAPVQLYRVSKEDVVAVSSLKQKVSGPGPTVAHLHSFDALSVACPLRALVRSRRGKVFVIFELVERACFTVSLLRQWGREVEKAGRPCDGSTTRLRQRAGWGKSTMAATVQQYCA